MTPSPALAPAPHRQRGVYAVEFGLVFLLAFAMLYAVLCFGMLFTVRLGMQNAAEEGARAGLRFQSGWKLRLAEAERETTARLTWMKYPPAPRAQLCQMGSTVVCRDSTSSAAPLPCNAALNQLCQIVVQVNYAPYGDSSMAWLPPLPGVLLPGGTTGANAFTLSGRAGLLLDERTL